MIRTFSLALILFLNTVVLGDYTVNSSSVEMKLSDTGKIVSLKFGSKQYPVTGQTVLDKCSVVSDVTSRRLANGGVEFSKKLNLNGTSKSCVLKERFLPQSDSIRWEVEIQGTSDELWSTLIESQLIWTDPEKLKFWTTWGDSGEKPQSKKVKKQEHIMINYVDQLPWSDPLHPQPMRDLWMTYGGSWFGDPMGFAAPIAEVIDEQNDTGLSFIHSPDSFVLEMNLKTEKNGRVGYIRKNHRISDAGKIKFTMDIVAHRGDWRDGLGWMVEKYPQYFESTNPLAHQIGGCGAYSSEEKQLDIAALSKMGFMFNWKASFDFPYMGMFVPPVDGDEEWTSFKGTKTSNRQMNDYAKRLRDAGFYCLNYFNVYEIGNRLEMTADDPKQLWGPRTLVKKPRVAEKDADLWKTSSDYVQFVMNDALYRTEDGKVYAIWENDILFDPLDPAGEKHIIEQAKAHVEKLPASSGIAIDCIKHARRYNVHRDDGISLVDGKPVRSMLVSYNSIMDKIEPIFHDNNKVIFGNTMYRRLDISKYLDGFYDEMAHYFSLNINSFLGLKKPVVMWTSYAGNLKEDGPDYFFQKHLYMGAFPTAPFPGNDHTLQPDPWTDQQYLDYGPLLNALYGRKWVLIPHVISVLDSQAKANVFEIPGGYAVPVTFGENKAKVQLNGLPLLKNQKGYKVSVLHPSSAKWSKLKYCQKADALTLDVPLKRGCAMIKILHSWMEPSERCFVDKQKIKLETLIKKAKIRYTLDGSEVTFGSKLYKRPFVIDKTTQVDMAVFLDDQKVYQMLPRTFVKTLPASPKIQTKQNDIANYFKDELELTISMPIEYKNAKVYYTIDGTSPTKSSKRYTKPFKINDSCVVKAFVVVKGINSEVSSRTFILDRPAAVPDVHLSDLKSVKATSGYPPFGPPKMDMSIWQKPLAIAGKPYEKGIGVAPYSELIFDLKSEYKRFVSVVGVNDAMKDYSAPSIGFEVYIDGNQVYKTPVLKVGDYRHIDIAIPEKSRQIKLVATDGGDGINCDHADWAMAGFLLK